MTNKKTDVTFKESGFWQDIGAYAIDLLVTSICIGCLFPLYLGQPYFLFVVAFLVNWYYFAKCESCWGKTLGKKCFHLQVIGNRSMETLLTAYGIDILLLILALFIAILMFGLFLVIALFNAYWHNTDGLLLFFYFVGYILIGSVVLTIGVGKAVKGLKVVQDLPKNKKKL